MNRNTARHISILLWVVLLVVSFSFQAEAADRKNFLWKASSGKATVYLLGSIHFMKKDSYPLNRKIESAFDGSGSLVVEANVNDIGRLDIFKLTEGAFYLNGDTLEKHVSRETLELVKRETAALGLPFEIINLQRPWFLAMSLTSLELVKSGYDPALGIDMHFLAKAGGKTIIELESLDYQIGLFSNFSDREQELFLLHTLKEIKQLSKETDAIVNTWKEGNAGAIEALLSKSIGGNPQMAGIHEKILFERNRNMADRIQDFLKTDRTYFVVVGAGHLIGNKGIIELLKKKGYSIEQL